jgi:magnesium transporter
MRHTRLYRDGVLEAKDFPAAQISEFLQQPDTVVWLDLCEPDQQDLAVVSQEFGLHPLTVEDAVQQHERPKLDRYQDHYFLTAYAVSLDPATGSLTTSELAAFTTPRALITVRKDPRFDIDGGGGTLGRLSRPGRPRRRLPVVGAARLRRRRPLRHRAAAG